MSDQNSSADARALEAAAAFGSLIRERRKALKMRQEQLALATGVGRRFVIELEAGKPSCQLGRSLVVAQALGFGFVGETNSQPDLVPGLDLPEFIDETIE